MIFLCIVHIILRLGIRSVILKSSYQNTYIVDKKKYYLYQNNLLKVLNNTECARYRDHPKRTSKKGNLF